MEDEIKTKTDASALSFGEARVNLSIKDGTRVIRMKSQAAAFIDNMDRYKESGHYEVVRLVEQAQYYAELAAMFGEKAIKKVVL